MTYLYLAGVLPEESTQGSASSSAHRAQDAFIPTRKVRQVPGMHPLSTPFSKYVVTDEVVPGGGTLTIGNLFGGDDEPAPNRRVASGGSSKYAWSQVSRESVSLNSPLSVGVLPENSPAAGQDFIPTRKVRQPPGKPVLSLGL